MSAQWKDISSYSRGEKRTGEPKTVELNLGCVKLVVTRHIHHPGRWMALCRPFIVEQVLDCPELEDAKREALKMLRERVEDLSADIDVA